MPAPRIDDDPDARNDAQTLPHQTAARRVSDRAPRPGWLGVNFWSRAGGPRMWARYDGAVVRSELDTLARHGLGVTRSFCFWPDFVPEPEHLDETVLERFTDFLDAHVAAGLGTIPTVLVGHMSGENWDPAWRGGRDLYRDVWLVGQQAWFAEALATRFSGHPAVVGWLVSNEMPLYGGPASEEVVTAWARILVHALRAGGAQQPVSLGDGAWGIETSGVDNGYSLRSLAPLVDFVGPHAYPMQDDAVRQALAAAFACELAGGFGKPVVLEEFGLTSDFAADEHAAGYYRQVLHTTLLAGATGWLAWNNCDYDDLAGDDPYRHHPFEMHFGLTDRDGRPKPQLGVMEEFSGLVDELGRDGWAPVEPEVAIVVPEHFERDLPFTTQAFRHDIRDALFQSYVAAKEADLPVCLTRERDGIAPTSRLYLAPCAKLLTTGGLQRLRELAHGGSTVYLSYFAGSTPNQRGPWITWLEEIFGIRHQLHYGLVDPIEGQTVELELVQPLGALAAGTRLRFAVAGEQGARSHLPVEPVGATVVAVDGDGRAALLRHEIGAGSTVFCTYPLERMAASAPRVNPEDTWRLYAALAESAGVVRPVSVPDPRVVAGAVRHGSATTLVLVNCSAEPIVAEPVLPAAGGGSRSLAPLAIGPMGVAVIPAGDEEADLETVPASHEGGDSLGAS
jgi:endo-1,4-beta-mannosidase